MKRSSRSRRPSSQGFNLVVLVMAVTVLNVLLALALPAWSTMIRREKEHELIFRGLQYAEAVRVFQVRHGRLPTRITELIEVQPRSIRQLWKNPVAEDGSWLLLPAQGQQVAGRPGQQVQPANPNQNQQGQNQQGQNQQGRPNPPRQPQAVRVVPPKPGETVLTPVPSLPFIGVASPEGEDSLTTFLGSNEIRSWRFTQDIVAAMQQSPDLSFARPVNSGQFWRPFPPGVVPPNEPGRNQLNPTAGGGQPLQTLPNNRNPPRRN